MGRDVTTKAMRNGERLAAVVEERVSAAMLYRTHVIGTASGRAHRDVYVGTVRLVDDDDIPTAPAGYDFSVGSPGAVFEIVGWISQRGTQWIAEDAELGPLGRFESAAAAAGAITGRC